MRGTQIATVIAFGLFATGCKLDLGLGDATSNIKDGLSDLSKGLKEIDPVAAQKMFNENAELREKLNMALQKASSYSSSGGVVVLQGAKIRLLLDSYVGEFKIDAWNGDQQILISYPLRMSAMILPDRVLEYGKSKLAPNPALITVFSLSKNPDEMIKNTVDRQQYAQWSFDQYISKLKPKTLGGNDDVTLNYTFGGEGLKTIKISITPTKIVTGSNWNIKGKIVAEYPDGKSDFIVGFGKDGEAIGSPIEAITFNLIVKNGTT